MLFYGKANDEKHYFKVAGYVREISARYETAVVRGSVEGAGSLSVFEIWAFEDHESVGYRFWVDPLEGAWKDTWIYHPGAAKRDGSWVNCYSPDRIGEPGNWGYYGGRRPFAATNFAKTTAAYFFKPNGPLER